MGQPRPGVKRHAIPAEIGRGEIMDFGENIHDIVVIGGGPAGLTAAVYASRAGKSVLVLEKSGFGGQIAWSPRVENFPATAALSGVEFSDRLLGQALEFGAEADLVEATGLSRCGELWQVGTADGPVQARAVILATGARHMKLGVAREDELAGNGVCYCAVCDGAFYKGRPVAVVGGGNAALQDALLLSNSCSQVYIIHRRARFRAEEANVRSLASRPNVTPLMNSRVIALEGEGELTGLLVEDLAGGTESRLAVDALFVAVGYEADNAPFGDVARLDAGGWFDSGEDCLTVSPGVFVAGDCRAKGVRQLTTAVGDGACAAVAACRYVDSIS